MLTIGLTGGIGSGKSQVADYLATLGAAIIDTDVIAHELTRATGAAMPAIKQAFGANMLLPDGALNRAAMRERVFADSAVRKQLEAILHPLIFQTAWTQAENAQAQTPYTVFVVPLLAEARERWAQRLTRICVVDCSPDTQVARVRTRSGLTPAVIARIMSAQASRQARLALADDVIQNDADMSLNGLYEQARALHQKWLGLAAESAITSTIEKPAS